MYVYIFRYNYIHIQSHSYTCKRKLNPMCQAVVRTSRKLRISRIDNPIYVPGVFAIRASGFSVWGYRVRLPVAEKT